MSSNDQHHKDSCLYSVDIAKQFITLSSGGVAFVVAMAIASTTPVPNIFIWSAALFIVSIGFGLVYVMSVIAHINKEKNYDVYTSQLKIFAAIQVIAFLVSIVMLAYVVLWKINNKVPSSVGTQEKITIEAGFNKLTKDLEGSKNIIVKINSKGEIEFKAMNNK